jgi:hypothetical protein
MELTANFLLILTIIEISKNVVTNNYFIKNLFFPVVEKSSNKKEILNWLFNLFSFLASLTFIFISIIYFLVFIFAKKLSFLIFLFLIPLIILDSFFIINKKFSPKNKYIFTRSSTFFFYAVLFIFFFNYKNYNLIFLGLTLIISLETVMNYFLLKNKLNLKINTNYSNDFRNYYFVKKFVKYFFKSQIIKIIILIIFIILVISGVNLITL